MFSILSRRCPLLATSLSVLFCLLSMLISDSRFDLVWFRLSCDHGWIRSGSVNVRKQHQNNNNNTDEKVMESYSNIPLDDISHFLVSNVLFRRGTNPFHTNFKQYTPLAAKDLSISLGSNSPNIPLNTCKCSTETLLYLGHWYSDCT